MPKRPSMCSIMSLAVTPRGSAPSHHMRMVSGTRSQISPMTTTPNISVLPTPNM